MITETRKKPFFSVVIPTYNHANFLRAAIVSCISQSFSNFEILVLDNHSTDHTEEVCESFNDRRISVFKVQNNGVIAVSRNVGIDRANGDWIAFLDSDDVWFPGKLESIYEYISKGCAADVYCHAEVHRNLNTDKAKTVQYGPYKNNFYKYLLLEGNKLSTSATVVRRSFLIENDLLFSEQRSFITAEDFEFWLQIANSNATFEFIGQALGQYSLHNSNNSNSFFAHKESYLSVMRYHIFNVQDFDSDKEKLWLRVQSRGCCDLFVESVRRSHYLAGAKNLFAAFNLSALETLKVFWRKLISLKSRGYQ